MCRLPRPRRRARFQVACSFSSGARQVRDGQAASWVQRVQRRQQLPQRRSPHQQHAAERRRADPNAFSVAWHSVAGAEFRVRRQHSTPTPTRGGTPFRQPIRTSLANSHASLTVLTTCTGPPRHEAAKATWFSRGLRRRFSPTSGFTSTRSVWPETPTAKSGAPNPTPARLRTVHPQRSKALTTARWFSSSRAARLTSCAPVAASRPPVGSQSVAACAGRRSECCRRLGPAPASESRAGRWGVVFVARRSGSASSRRCRSRPRPCARSRL